MCSDATSWVAQALGLDKKQVTLHEEEMAEERRYSNAIEYICIEITFSSPANIFQVKTA
jgi:hypothetical protein